MATVSALAIETGAHSSTLCRFAGNSNPANKISLSSCFDMSSWQRSHLRVISTFRASLQHEVCAHEEIRETVLNATRNVILVRTQSVTECCASACIAGPDLPLLQTVCGSTDATHIALPTHGNREHWTCPPNDAQQVSHAGEVIAAVPPNILKHSCSNKFQYDDKIRTNQHSSA